MIVRRLYCWGNVSANNLSPKSVVPLHLCDKRNNLCLHLVIVERFQEAPWISTGAFGCCNAFASLLTAVEHWSDLPFSGRGR